MLITERITKDKKFLHFPKELLTHLGLHPFTEYHRLLRAIVLISEKFVVPDYLGGTVETSTENIKKVMAITGSVESGFKRNVGAYEERMQHYTEFCKLPFPFMTVENNEMCWVLHIDGEYFYVTTIDKNGVVNLISTYIDQIAQTPDGYKFFHFLFKNEISGHVNDQKHYDQMAIKPQPLAKYVHAYQHLSLMNTLCVLEALLYINAKNKREVEVRVSQGLKRVSKKKKVSAGPDLVYKVLVLDRAKPTLVTTKDISDYIYSPVEERAARRATYVRGHLKVRKTGTYWWNPFIRDAKNALTIGMVDKTYDVKIPQA